jgi:transcriptional regulator with XRE-family HTH domain
MDDAPYVGDLDLDAVNTRDELAALLRTVHIRADKPSLRTLEVRTRHSATSLSKTVTAEMLRGMRFPRKAVMLAFLQACGIPDTGLESWQRTWERIAASEEAPVRAVPIHAASGHGHPADTGQRYLSASSDVGITALAGTGDADGPESSVAPSPESAEMQYLRKHIDRLSADNERLRTQLTAARQRTVEELPPGDAGSGPRTRSSAVRRRELSTELRALRAEMGMTAEQVAEHLMCSLGKVRRMETGFRSGTVRDVRDLCDLYGVTDPGRRDHLMELARPGRQPSWHRAYGPRFSTYLELEADASSIKTYETTLVSGLVQTADYARAVLETYAATLSPDALSPEVIEQRVEGRLVRQRRLTEADPPYYWFILDEATLHRMVGGPVVMRAQLKRLIDVAKLPNVTVQVVPYEVGCHPAGDGSFTILDFTAHVDSLVYTEDLVGDLIFERPGDVAQYKRALRHCRLCR